MRPAAMPARFEEALAAVAPAPGAGEDPGRRALRERLAGHAPAVEAWSTELAASPGPASLDHNDLHPGNVLPGGRTSRAGCGSTTGATASWRTLRRDARPARRHRRRARGPARRIRASCARGTPTWTPSPITEPPPSTQRALALARRLGTIARALTWERAVRSSHRQGEPVPPAWADAPLRTLAALLDGS
jgi:hypothetical protein